MNARVAAVAELERRIGHTFQDRDLLERALTHSSVGKGAKVVRHNERLEFLGDRVLNLCVAERIMELKPDVPEGELAKLMNHLVNYHACARAARDAGLPAAMRVDASATRVGARTNDRVLGDACEALIAALYREGGLELARAFVHQFWADAFEHLDVPQKDPKTALQEWAMARSLPIPEYVVVHQEGAAHNPRFTIEVRVQGQEPQAAEAGAKRDAEKLAAARLLERLEKDEKK
ncbi:ribonuclease III [Phenylobacterium deserti]|uniref:Ribonuclease 3 n=1 Tax=Phenylobacterium deserti TaxID=1914756 RepID=A0A328A8V8_9CAUL|nr:ribonuclease III [Phenylobacterium deserti]RAK50929.1 ribonuclease III [Phenylobacterium deserti]